MGYVLVFVGGGLGASFRHGVNILAARLLGTAFPYGTVLINVSGSLAMGLIAGYLAGGAGQPQQWQLFLMTGILGGFTTFSAFSLETVLLYERGRLGAAAIYVVASVVLAIAALFAGLTIIRGLM